MKRGVSWGLVGCHILDGFFDQVFFCLIYKVYTSRVSRCHIGRTDWLEILVMRPEKITVVYACYDFFVRAALVGRVSMDNAISQLEMRGVYRV